MVVNHSRHTSKHNIELPHNTPEDWRRAEDGVGERKILDTIPRAWADWKRYCSTWSHPAQKVIEHRSLGIRNVFDKPQARSEDKPQTQSEDKPYT